MNLRQMTNPDLITDLSFARAILARHPDNAEALRVYEDTAAELVRRLCRIEVEDERVDVEVDVETELALLAERFGGDLMRDVPVGAALDALTPEAWDEFIQRAQTYEGAREDAREGTYESA